MLILLQTMRTNACDSWTAAMEKDEHEQAFRHRTTSSQREKG